VNGYPQVGTTPTMNGHRPRKPALAQRRYPSVGVVVPTRGRDQELRAAVAGVLNQDYPGEVRLAVVSDCVEPPLELGADPRVEVLVNTRTPGLAGTRNTGTLALETDLIAFCDDDDVWERGKLRAQVAALGRAPTAEMASCGIVVQYGDRYRERLIGRDAVTYEELLRSRMVMVHSSTYLFKRDALLAGIGLSDETIPHGQNEDWDLALRAARRRPIAFVDEPLVQVCWGRSSYFAHEWQTRADGLLWMLRRHPEIAASGVSAGRVYGQLAFAYACLGQRDEVWRWARRALRRNWHERRVPFALAVASGLLSGDAVLHALHSMGHGI
jgi:glycosyltransferase involved in cell wall biosynthesis